MLLTFTNDASDNWYEGIIQTLFESNYQKVYKIAWSYTLNDELAKDATQETFYKAFLKIDSLKDKSKFDSWICMIAVNVCKNMMKYKSSHKSLSIFDDDGKLKDNLVELSDFNVPDEIYEKKELRQELLKYISEADTDVQRIINLKYYQDLTFEQIAAQMNMNENTVKSKVRRFKERMALKLKIYFDIKG